MRSLENLKHDRAHDGGKAIAKCALREHHHIDEPEIWRVFECDQHHETDREAKACDGPDGLAANAVRSVSQDDLSWNAEQTDKSERPDADIRREPDVQQIFGLVHLHGIP